MSTADTRQNTPADIRGALVAERAALLASAQGRREEVPTGPTGVSDGWGETDHLTVAEFEDLSAQLDSMLAAAVEEIDAALSRLDAGTYGSCVDCAEAIHPERLAALPAAARCVECQTRVVRR